MSAATQANTLRAQLADAERAEADEKREKWIKELISVRQEKDKLLADYTRLAPVAKRVESRENTTRDRIIAIRENLKALDEQNEASGGLLPQLAEAGDKRASRWVKDRNTLEAKLATASEELQKVRAERPDLQFLGSLEGVNGRIAQLERREQWLIRALNTPVRPNHIVRGDGSILPIIRSL